MSFTFNYLLGGSSTTTRLYSLLYCNSLFYFAYLCQYNRNRLLQFSYHRFAPQQHSMPLTERLQSPQGLYILLEGPNISLWSSLAFWRLRALLQVPQPHWERQRWRIYALSGIQREHLVTHICEKWQKGASRPFHIPRAARWCRSSLERVSRYPSHQQKSCHWSEFKGRIYDGQQGYFLQLTSKKSSKPCSLSQNVVCRKTQG